MYSAKLVSIARWHIYLDGINTGMVAFRMITGKFTLWRGDARIIDGFEGIGAVLAYLQDEKEG